MTVVVAGKICEDFQSQGVAALLLQGLEKHHGKMLEFDLGMISSLNSVGISSWIQVISELEKHCTLRFSVLGSTFVEVGFIIPNVLGRSENQVLRLQLPYRCVTCNESLGRGFELQTLFDPKGRFHAPTQSCEKCRGLLEFDAVEEEYAGFLERRRR